MVWYIVFQHSAVVFMQFPQRKDIIYVKNNRTLGLRATGLVITIKCCIIKQGKIILCMQSNRRGITPAAQFYEFLNLQTIF